MKEVTQWIEAISSSLALIGTTIALLLQRKTIADQQKQIAVLLRADKRSILPFFKITSQQILPKEIEGKKSFEVEFELIKNDAFEVTTGPILKEGKVLCFRRPDNIHFTHMEVYRKFSLTFYGLHDAKVEQVPMNIKTSIDADFKEIMIQTIFSRDIAAIHFIDIDGNRYLQRVSEYKGILTLGLPKPGVNVMGVRHPIAE
jgi:hypothetical protein